MTCLETVVYRLLRATPGFFHGYMISQEDVWTLGPTGEKGRVVVVDEGKLFIRGGVTGNGKSQGKARTRNAAATRQHPIHKLLRCQSENFLNDVGEDFDFDKVNVDAIKCLAFEYLPSIVVTLANLLGPMLIFTLIGYEKYKANKTLLLSLAWCIFLRYVSFLKTA